MSWQIKAQQYLRELFSRIFLLVPSDLRVISMRTIGSPVCHLQLRLKQSATGLVQSTGRKSSAKGSGMVTLSDWSLQTCKIMGILLDDSKSSI
jgi:hypothetical protein